MAEGNDKPVQKAGDVSTAAASSKGEIEEFLRQARTMVPATDGRGRLIFALDATMSRQPTWDAACRIQAEMFTEAAKIGSLEIQLVYYRGFNECKASGWVTNGQALGRLMTGIAVRGGYTQIGRVLAHARNETKKRKVGALVFIGDALEEPVDALTAIAGELGLLGLKVLIFQEGQDRQVEYAYREIARLSGGAYARFDISAAGQLSALLKAAAAYAAGGTKALAASASGHLLLEQLR